MLLFGIRFQEIDFSTWTALHAAERYVFADHINPGPVQVCEWPSDDYFGIGSLREFHHRLLDDVPMHRISAAAAAVLAAASSQWRRNTSLAAI